jgi:hypothetical protein
VCNATLKQCTDCSTNADCDNGTICNASGHCGCNTTTDCHGTGTCLSGVCGCNVDADCVDADCGTGLKCWGGKCTTPITCGANQDCNNDGCVAGKCSISGVACSHPGDCTFACDHQKHTLQLSYTGGSGMFIQTSKVTPHFQQPGLVYADLARPGPSTTEQLCVAPTMVIKGAPTTGGTLASTGLGPYADVRYNLGPVGPVVAPMGPGNIAWATGAVAGDHAQCKAPDLCVWVANWFQNGDVYLLTGHNCQAASKTCPGSTCSWTAQAFNTFSAFQGNFNPVVRYQALTWSRLHNNLFAGGNIDTLVGISENYHGVGQGVDIFPFAFATEAGRSVGFGSLLYGGPIRDHNLGYTYDGSGNAFVAGAQSFRPNHGNRCTNCGDVTKCPGCFCPSNDQTCEDFLQTVLNVSTDPFFGDVYMEGVDLSGHDELLVMRADDMSVHNLYDVAKGQRLCTSAGGDQACPANAWGWVSGQGRVSASSGGRVERMVPTFGGTPSFTDYPINQ